MSKYRHPGVYIEEISQPGPIQGVTTNTLGFVGIAEKGIDPSGLNPDLYNTPVMITGWQQFTEIFGNIIWNRFLAPAVYAFYKKGGVLCYIVRVEDTGGTPGTVDIPNFATATATSSGIWANVLGIDIVNSPLTADPTPTPGFTLNVVYVPEDGATNEVYETFVENNRIPDTGDGTAKKYVLESFGGLSLPSTIEAGGIEDAVKPIFNRINTQSLFIRLAVPTTVPSRPDNTTAPIMLTGGADGTIDYGSETNETGYYAYNKLQDDTINIMAIPDLPTLTKDGVIDESLQGGVISQATAYCQQKMSMFFIADPPFGLSIPGIKEFKEGTGTPPKSNVTLSSNYGALYYPWIMINQPGTTKNIMVPPSGSVAGVYASTDNLVGVWKAPAGINFGNIPFSLDLETNVTDAQQDVLNPYGINAIRELPGYGRVVWGARTLAVDTEWTYINVRRLFIYLENSIKRATWWVVFEPNSPRLWGTVSRNITAFLTLMWQQGALYGATADEAFFVKIDEDNNPRELQAKGELHIDIGVAPVFPAEFVIISFQQMTLSAES